MDAAFGRSLLAWSVAHLGSILCLWGGSRKRTFRHHGHTEDPKCLTNLVDTSAMQSDEAEDTENEEVMLGRQLGNKNLLLQPCMHQASFDQVWKWLFMRTPPANLENTLLTQRRPTNVKKGIP